MMYAANTVAAASNKNIAPPIRQALGTMALLAIIPGRKDHTRSLDQFATEKEGDRTKREQRAWLGRPRRQVNRMRSAATESIHLTCFGLNHRTRFALALCSSLIA